MKQSKSPAYQLRKAKTSQYDNVQVIQGSDERIYNRVYVHALINNRLVKLLKESVQYV